MEPLRRRLPAEKQFALETFRRSAEEIRDAGELRELLVELYARYIYLVGRQKRVDRGPKGR